MDSFSIKYNYAMQPLIQVRVGGQDLNLVFDASSANTLVFVQEKNACQPSNYSRCYSAQQALRHATLKVCAENQHSACEMGVTNSKYLCQEYLNGGMEQLLERKLAHLDELIIDGISYRFQSVEALEDVKVPLANTSMLVHLTALQPLRLLVEPFQVSSTGGSLKLFEGTSGLLGASGLGVSCRSSSVWTSLLANRKPVAFAMDFQPPPRSSFAQEAVTAAADGMASSLVVLNRIPENMVWSQMKPSTAQQDGMHEFLLYHPTVCGIDLLEGTSSNWLTIIDTSGPCLQLPAVLFDSLFVHIPVKCPFRHGESAVGRLCAPDRSRSSSLPGGRKISLPAMSFQLEDNGGATPPRVLRLPLERLVFDDGHGGELLCVSRGDTEGHVGPDMMYSHIGFGSLVVSALPTALLSNQHRVGFIERGNASVESTDAFCSAPTTCLSPMQTYHAPTNTCKDPDCSKYAMMQLDPKTKMCVWRKFFIVQCAIVITVLVALDLFSHRLYKKVIERAVEVCQ